MPERFARVCTLDERICAVDLFNSQRIPVSDDAGYAPGTIIKYTLINGRVSLTFVVAGADSALAVIWQALSDCGVDPAFNEDVLTEVQEIVDNPGIDDASLADLTHLPFITIDNEDSRDLDQAMHIESDNERFTLHYALADAAHFVRPGSAIFDEALRRGSSFYVPGFAVPMLPAALSEGLVSLNESVLRRALVFIISFDANGVVIDTTVTQAKIISAAKLSYDGVERYYGGSQRELADKPYTPTLDALRRLGQLLIIQARSRNVVEYDRSSVDIVLDDAGESFQLIDSKRLQVEKYNEQISLVCNAEGAELLNEAGLSSVVQAVYRVHDAPETDRLIKFSRLLKGLISHYQLDPQLWVWRWRDGKYGCKENLSQYLKRLREGNVNADLLAAVQHRTLMLSTASRFSAMPGIHHSLKLDYYARFSSPMREMAGIFTHREYLQLCGRLPDSVEDEALREKVIEVANRSKETQKKLNKAVMKRAIDQLFDRQLRQPAEQRDTFEGTVMSVRSTRVYVQLDEPAISVKVYLRELSKLTGYQYRLHSSGAYIEAGETVEFALGQRLVLQVASYSDDAKRWYLQPVVST